MHRRFTLAGDDLANNANMCGGKGQTLFGLSPGAPLGTA